jgi:uncharacterized protein YhbP (UPF0306 family)
MGVDWDIFEKLDVLGMTNNPLEANDKELRERIQRFACRQSVMTLAVGGDRGPWAAAVLYVVGVEGDAGICFYFVSSDKSQHVTEAKLDSPIAAEIHSSYRDWQSILGIQMRGLLTRVTAEHRARVEELYYARYPEIRAMVDSPGNDEERKIARAFLESRFFRLTPSFIRLVDNSAGFGTRAELRFRY